MEMVQDMNTRQVTFSKRRTGLFKKASELATLCNAELGIVVFSPGGKPFSYGKPNLDSVAERFMREYDDSDSGDEEKSGNYRPKLKRLSERLDLLNQEVEASMNSMNTKIGFRQSMVGLKVKSITCRLRLASCFSPENS